MTVPLFQGSTLRVDLHEHVLLVTLNRRPCNEIGTTTLAEIETVATLAHDASLGARALVWHSTVERGFCAGADLRELYEQLVAFRATGGGDQDARQRVRAFIERIHAAFDRLDTAPLVTVAAVHGVVFGGGFELALTSDVIVADKTTRFCFPELRLGIVPGFGGIPRLQRDVGNAVVRDLLLTGRSINAARAHTLGLVSQLVGNGQSLDAAMGVARQATRFDTLTVVRGKKFAKPIPTAHMEEEKELFCSMITSVVVEQALKKFVESTDVRPYLP